MRLNDKDKLIQDLFILKVFILIYHGRNNFICTGCGFKNDQYHLFSCHSNGSEGMQFSNYPFGSFGCARKMEDMEGIDLRAFVDDHGAIYWGQFDKMKTAKLNPNMI